MIWQPVSSGNSIKFAAQNGIKIVIALTGESIVDQFMGEYQNAAAEQGNKLALGQDTCLGFGFCIGDSLEEEQIQEGKILSGYLVCQVCKERYPVIDGIPNLLPPDLR